MQFLTGKKYSLNLCNPKKMLLDNYFYRTCFNINWSSFDYWEKVHNSHTKWKGMQHGTSATPGIPLISDPLKKAPHNSGGETLWPLGSLAFHRLGSNTTVLSRVHSHLPSIFSSPIWYAANERKFAHICNIHVFIFLTTISKLYRYLWRIETVLNWKRRTDSFTGHMVSD